MHKRLIKYYLLFVALMVTGVWAHAQQKGGRAPGSVTDTLTVSVLYVVDVTASFEEVSNLTLLNLGLTGVPSLVTDEARLPAGVSIPAAFPVKIDITPPNILMGLEFEGVAMVELDTENLDYTPGTRLRLFSAHDGGDFVDITEMVSQGSYRVRGSQGEFSEFLIALDERDPAAIVTVKFARLSGLLTTHASSIDATLLTTLSNLLASAQANYAANDTDAAKADIASLESTVAGATPAQIPNLWRAAQDVTNVAGLLRAAAGTLIFSLEDARDTDLDGVYEFEDNCTLVANPSQCDTNGDGFGNHCDADLDNNGSVNSFDLSVLRAALGSSGANDADLDCNGIVNSFDLVLMRQQFGGAPGPTAPD